MSILPTGAPVAPDATPDTSAVSEVTSTEQAQPKDRFDVFVRKEKQLLRQKRDIEARASAMEAKYKDYDTTHIPRQRLIDDPLAVLSDLGIDYNKLSEQVLNNPNATDPTILALKKQIAALEAKTGQTQQPTANNESYDKAIEHIRNQVKSIVDNSTDFEVIRDSGAYERAVEIIEDHYNESGMVMDYKEACVKAEQELFDESVAYFSKIKKLQSHFAPKTPEPVKAKVDAGPQVTPRTLSNNLSTGATQSGNRSEADRVKAAIALAQSLRKA